MPMFVAHAAVGLTVYESLRHLPVVSLEIPESWKVVLFLVLVANAPDIDIIPWLRECRRTQSFDPLAFKPHHREWTHSLVFAGGFAVAGGLLATLWWSGSFVQWALLVFAVYSSHILADFLLTTKVECGVQIFWPFSKTRHSLLRTFPSWFPLRKPDSLSRSFLREVWIILSMCILVWLIW